MGFAEQARRIIEYNRGLLREKSFFKDLGKPIRKSNPAQIDSNKLKENFLKQVSNHHKRNLLRRIIIVTVIFFVVLLTAIFIYLF